LRNLQKNLKSKLWFEKNDLKSRLLLLLFSKSISTVQDCDDIRFNASRWYQRHPFHTSLLSTSATAHM